MKRYILRAGLVAVALIVAVPIAINLCYSADTVIFPTKWGAADVLDYYGTILGAAVTVGALIITILFTRKQIERDAYLKSQREKWDTVHQIVMDAIEKNNPMRLFAVTIRFGDGDLPRCIRELHEFFVDAKESLDKIKCFISPEDYSKIEALVSEILTFQDDLLALSHTLSAKYQEIQESSRYYHDDSTWHEQMMKEAYEMRLQIIELHKERFQHLL